MKYWQMVWFGVWKSVDTCSSLLPGVRCSCWDGTGCLHWQGRTFLLLLLLLFLLLCPTSRWRGSCSGVAASMPSDRAGFYAGGMSWGVWHCLAAACCLFSCHIRCACGCWRLSSKVVLCSHPHAAIRRGRPGQCPKTSLLLWLLLGFHHMNPMWRTLQPLPRCRITVPALIQQSSAAQVCLSFYFLMVNYWHRRCWIIHWIACKLD